MKKLLTVLFLFVAATSFGQVQQKLPQNYVSPSYQIDSNQTIPLGISRLRSVNGGRNIGQIRYNQADSSFYIYSGTRWIKFASYAIVPVPQGTTTGIDSITFTAPRTLCYWKNDTSTCYTLANSIDSAKVIGGTQLCFYVGGVSTCYGITGNVVSSAIDSITISGTNYCWWHNNTPKCVSINNTTAFDTTHIYAVLNRLEFKMDTLRKVFFSRDGSIIASYSADWDTVFAEVDTNKISAMIYAIINGGASSHTDPLAIQSIRAVSDTSFENTHGDGSIDTTKLPLSTLQKVLNNGSSAYIQNVYLNQINSSTETNLELRNEINETTIKLLSAGNNGLITVQTSDGANQSTIGSQYIQTALVYTPLIQSLDSTVTLIIKNGSTTSKAIALDTSGNVGIGTTTPTEKLEVTGNIKSSTGLVSDSNGLIKPYKTYIARLVQELTSDPVATVLQNDIGSIVWARDDEGTYIGTLAGAFTTNKTWATVSTTAGNVNLAITTNTVEIYSLGDDRTYWIEIRVYN